MEIEKDRIAEIQKIFLLYNPSPLVYRQLTHYLHVNCRKNVQKTRQFLQAFHQQSASIINFDSFCKVIRIIKRIVKPLKNIEVQANFSQIIIAHGHLYFPNQTTIHANKKYDQYRELYKTLAISQPQNLKNIHHVIAYLTQEYSAQWAAGLIQKINNEALIDKKQRQAGFLKVNRFFSGFIAKNFEKIRPQLDRLLVRSEANIEIWQQFFRQLQVVTIDQHVVAFLNKAKYLFQNHSENSIKIVNYLTCDLTDQKTILQVLTFLNGLVSTQHNVKKKIVYIKMLEGVIKSIQKLKDSKIKSQYSQQILVVLVSGLIKFTEAEDYQILAAVLNPLLPLITQPTDAIAKGLKLYLKNTNKFILVLANSIMAHVYKQEHKDFPSVQQIYKHFTSQLDTNLKKFQTNWQWILPIIDFLSSNDQSFLSNIQQDLPLFRSGALGLTLIEKKICLRLIGRYINYLKNQDDQEIPSLVYMMAILLLEQINSRETWNQFLNMFTSQQQIQLLSRGMYPLVLYPCTDLSKNKGNNFTTLQLFVWHKLRNERIELNSSKDLLNVAVLYNQLRPSWLQNISVSNQQNAKVSQNISQYMNSSLFDLDQDQDNKFSLKYLNQLEKVLIAQLRHQPEYLLQLIKKFTVEDYYVKDLQFLKQFQVKIVQNLTLAYQEFQQIQETVVKQNLHKFVQTTPRKSYTGVTMQVRMMSEQEVKTEKYRKHFLRMQNIFDKIIQKMLKTIDNHHVFNRVWQENTQNLLLMTKFPEHRMGVLKLVHRSVNFTAWNHSQCKQAKILSKYAQFFGEFFSLRHAGITPSVDLMKKCQQFLKQLLSLPFEQDNSGFILLSDSKDQFIMLLLNQMSVYLLENMQFDVGLKRLAISFYNKCFQSNISFNNQDQLFAIISKNINILANSEHIFKVLQKLLRKVPTQRYKQLFDDILNYVQQTKKLILSVINQLDQRYKPQFQEFIKLRILSLQSNQQISKLAQNLLNNKKQMKKSILNFNMKNFVKKNSKQTIQKLCIFIKEQITPQTCQSIFLMVLKASEQLFDQGFDQEGLEMLPYFLTINIQSISQNIYKPIFQLLIIKFTSREDYATLNKMSMDVGISIIKKYANKNAEKLLIVLESFINKSSGVSNIIFLGVLAPYLQGNKNLQLIERRITQLFKSNRQGQQKAISKCIPDLMSFFKDPQRIVENIFINIVTMKEEIQMGQAYLFSGLLKGVGYTQAQQYLDRLTAPQFLNKPKAQKTEKTGRIKLFEAMIENFGRVVELKSIKIINILIGYMADNNQDIRDLARKVGQMLIMKMSAFSVKILLPQLLKGLQEQQNWRIKISYIWILGIMANCSARQLQTSLPIIVPTLSTCLSNAHPTIRQKASEALNLIGETIKNPQISTSVNILIQALENPFQKSERALQILLKTKFSHFIDPPALSLIIPILDYCMRGRSSDLKAGACQVIGSIVELIPNPYDLLPYIKIINTGLKVALCDPLPQIRAISAMAIGRISAKIGIKEAEIYFKFVLEIIDSTQSNTTQRQGAAQAHAQMICSHTYQYFEESLNKIFEKLNLDNKSQKQGYILVFLYVPSIRNQQFQGFIRDVNQNMYTFVSEQEENIRNSAMMVEKVLINNYCLSHTDLLLDPLCDGVFQDNWKKRNSALILIGEMLNIIKSHMYNTRTNDKAYAYYRGLMAVYIIKDDDLQMPRLTANQVWNTYIQNTPKTIKSGLNELVKMWTRWTHSASNVVFKNIVAFSSKYAENYFTQILEYLQEYMKEPEHQIGVFQVLAEFVKRMNAQFLSKQSFKTGIRSLFENNLFTVTDAVRPWVAKSLAIYVQKMHQQLFFEELLYPRLAAIESSQESTAEYTYGLHLLKDLLKTNYSKVVDRVINRVISPPMSQFKIEVITNNAQRLANYLYSHFTVPATQVFVEEIYSLAQDKTKQNRLSLIIYCLEQVSLQLSTKYKMKFINMIDSHIEKGIRTFSQDKSQINKRILVIFINMLNFFLNSTALSEIQQLDFIIGRVGSLVFLQDQQLKTLGHHILLLLISDSKSPRTALYIKQMIVSFENQLQSKGEIIWSDEDSLHNYIQILVKGIAYGRQEVMQESLDMIDFVLDHTTKALIDKQILKIVGPLIRISNYPLLQKQKIRVMELLSTILKQNYKLDAYINQMLSVCLRLLQEFKNSQEIMHVVAETYLALLNATQHKQQLLTALLAKLRIFGTNLVQCFYFLVNEIMAQNIQLPKTIFEKIYEECLIILLHNEGKLPVKGLYYASKTAARLSILLAKPIQKLQKQINRVGCSYESIINYLHTVYQSKLILLRMQQIQIFLKETNRQKLYFLLKSLSLCVQISQKTRQIYQKQYLYNLIPESLIGFEEIVDVMEDFDGEEPEEQAEINRE